MRFGFAVVAGVAAAFAGIPEPDVVVYGAVTGGGAGQSYVPTSVTWSVSGNNETATSTRTTLVDVNGQTFYIAQVSFETRRLADNSRLETAPNTLELTPGPVEYTRTARIDGRRATIVSGNLTFAYGVALQGLVERVDLSVSGESFSAWSNRIFGSVVNQTADADGDGLSNFAEYLAGTDPKNPQSGVFVKNFTALSGGGYSFTWDSLTTKAYTVERSADLKTWATAQAAQPGTGGVMSYTDRNPGGAPQMFYRIRISDL